VHGPRRGATLPRTHACLSVTARDKTLLSQGEMVEIGALLD
jgi:hypothetical protein